MTERVSLADIGTHPALQARDPSLLKAREAVRQDERQEQHIADMATLLKADARAELVPILLAKVGDRLLVVDGHHRLAAYRRAKRKEIPARVETMTIEQASHASKIANIQHTKLEMRPAQKRNAMWHHLAHITARGTTHLPTGTSQRAIHGMFGGSRDTVQRMLQRLPEIDPTTFPPEHCDAITGFPHWRYVCATVRNGMYQQMQPEQRIAWLADKYRAKLAKLWEQFPPDAIDLAHGKLRASAADADAEERIAALDAAYMANADGPAAEF